ncbi:MAG: bifunctional folylpolyglutamate synthase/dihydrofolate synthase [Clostridia bacterium]|nr:bifunctional folylpolyglutamate synthase/dihydrofolate synthase [Clostridia bacterium]
MTYREALEYIHSTDWRGSKPGLSRITELCRRLGDPQDSLRFIHVAGTNGKGSVSAMTANVLRFSGRKVGLFTSPYVERFNERIMLNGRPIKNSERAEITEAVKKEADMMADGPTEFELITAIGFMFFKKACCDFVVLECGLGGRLDSTNVIKTPVLSVITGIALDHTQLLGGTTELIASEKAGIIKPGVPVVVGEVDGGALKVIEKEAGKMCSRICAVQQGMIRVRDISETGIGFSYANRDYRVGLPALYQTRNAACVIEITETLRGLGFSIDDRSLKRALLQTKWKARFETLSREPLVIYDGSHNPQGMAACCESIEKKLSGLTSDGKVNVLMGVMADKDYTEMISLLAPYVKKAFAVKPCNPRSLDAGKLAEMLKKKIRSVSVCGDLGEGVEKAVRTSEKDGRPLVCLGTLYMYSDVKKAVRKTLKAEKDVK